MRRLALLAHDCAEVYPLRLREGRAKGWTGVFVASYSTVPVLVPVFATGMLSLIAFADLLHVHCVCGLVRSRRR